MNRTIAEALASKIDARLTCIKRGSQPMASCHEDAIRDIMDAHAPSGSGIDNGTQLDLDKSASEKLIFTFGYHHMNDVGYHQWTDYKVIVKASLIYGLDIRITGRDVNGVKKYLYDVYSEFLNTTP